MASKTTIASDHDSHEEELRGLIGGSTLGALAALVIGRIADILGAVGFFPIEAIVRWIAGNSDTLGEFASTLNRKRKGRSYKNALNYVKGELVGSIAGPIVILLFHTVGVSFGLNPYGPLGVLISTSFAHSDNIGGMIADFISRKKKHGFKNGFISFVKSPYQQGNFIFISISVVISLVVRLNGFEPKENFLAGIEGSLMGSMDSIGAGIYANVVYKFRNRRAR